MTFPYVHTNTNKHELAHIWARAFWRRSYINFFQYAMNLCYYIYTNIPNDLKNYALNQFSV